MATPARKLGKSAVKNIVRFPSVKSAKGKSILVESILESKYCLHLEFDRDVDFYSPQPRTFQLTEESNVGTYTPDFYVEYISGSRCYVEVKPRKFSESEHHQRKFQLIESLLSQQNIGFSVVNEQEILRQPLLSNLERLYQFRKRPSLDMGNLYKCAQKVSCQMPLSILVEKLGDHAQLREIYTWLALDYLEFDQANEALSFATEVHFNVG